MTTLASIVLWGAFGCAGALVVMNWRTNRRLGRLQADLKERLANDPELEYRVVVLGGAEHEWVPVPREAFGAQVGVQVENGPTFVFQIRLDRHPQRDADAAEAEAVNRAKRKA